jgi:Cu-processing system ATP-binding protein
VTGVAAPAAFPLAGMAPAVTAVEAIGLRKRFGRHEVLRGVDLTISAGRVTGLVGPNAAGKTTLIKCLLDLVRPDAGELRVLGRAISAGEAYRAGVGYMPQAARFPENLTGREVLDLLADLRGPAAPRDLELIESFGLDSEMAKPVRALSGGTRQKLSAALALLFRPAVLVLDEPTAGLDPVSSGIFKDKLLRARDAGSTVLIATHTLSELEELADDVIFLLEGKVRFHGTLARLTQTTGFARLERAIAALMEASR